MKKPIMKRFSVGIPYDLYREFMIWAAGKDLKISAAIGYLIKKELGK